ncbi:MAG: hypothetical protein R2942_14325 [Ignavibacteria bacterium]
MKSSLVKLQEIRDLVERNKNFIERCEGVGHLPKQDCIDLGLTGPLLRACGIERDPRKNRSLILYMISWILIYLLIPTAIVFQDTM